MIEGHTKFDPTIPKLGPPTLPLAMAQTLSFTVNGQRRTLTVEPERPLLEVLREDLELTGAKFGCGEGECGACTVLVGGRPVFSCITPVSNAAGQTIQTLEGLAPEGKLHPVQEAFLSEDAFQCGYCTSGMILAVVGLLNEKPKPTEPEIAAWMEGHICRCCTYPRVLKAIQRATSSRQG